MFGSHFPVLNHLGAPFGKVEAGEVEADKVEADEIRGVPIWSCSGSTFDRSASLKI